MGSYLIHDFMTMADGGMHLAGCKLLVYALIYSYYRNGKEFFASEDYLANQMGYCRKEIHRALLSLIKSGFIEKSATKHPLYSTDIYTINETILSQFGPDDGTKCPQKGQNVQAGDKMSQDGGTKCPQKGQNVQAGDKMSQNNTNTNTNENDKREDSGAHPPFKYLLLNKKWEELCRQSKWEAKSMEALAIAQRQLLKVEPTIAYYMMEYAIERNYDRVFDDNEAIKKKASDNESQFYDAETRYRRKILQSTMNELKHISPPPGTMPPDDNFFISANGAFIKCSNEFAEWIEENRKSTFPILLKWTLGIQLHYNLIN